MSKIVRKKYIVVGIGELLWDMLPNNKRLGGAPANFAIHANALGAEAKIISAVGKDPDGNELISQLKKKQIVTDFIHENGHPTGHVNVSIDLHGHPIYTIGKNVAWDFLALTYKIETLANTCDAVCFGSLAQRNPESRKTIRAFLNQTSNSCLRIFDVNLRQDFFSNDILENSLQTANIVKLNEDELTILQTLLDLPKSTEKALQVIMDRYNLCYIALTQGASGSTMMDKTDVVFCPGSPLAIQDTVGAGDSFTAAMTMGILNGLPLDTINRVSGAIAGHVCSHVGATPDLPEWLIGNFNKTLFSSKTKKDPIPTPPKNNSHKNLTPIVKKTESILPLK